MKYHYYKNHSQLIELLLSPSLLALNQEEQKKLFSTESLLVLEDAYKALDKIQEAFRPYQARVERFYLSIQHVSFSVNLYKKLLNKGQDPKTIEEVYDSFYKLTKEELEDVFFDCLSDEVQEVVDDGNFLEQLDNLTDQPALKWAWVWARQHLAETVQGLVSLYKELLPLYQPYFEAYQKERDYLADHLKIDDLFEQTQNYHFPLKELLDATGKEDCEVIILSPWFNFSSISYQKNQTEAPAYLMMDSRIFQILSMSHKLDTERLTNILKLLGDENRYKVLLEIVQPKAKSKDIAKRLGITAANVSFHTQKLINANIILFNSKDSSSVKYKLNKTLLRESLDRLKRDLDL